MQKGKRPQCGAKRKRAEKRGVTARLRAKHSVRIGARPVRGVKGWSVHMAYHVPINA